MDELTTKAFEELLNLDEPWEVLSLRIRDFARIDIEIIYRSRRGKCPLCKQECRVRDYRKSREWRHLNTMQYETYLHCEVPRVWCESCDKITSLSVPWSESRNGITFLFENYAIDILTTSRSVEEGRKLLNISWYQLNKIKRGAVNRGLMRRSLEEIEELGMDEKSYARGHKYATILSDLSAGRVIDLVDGRKQEDAERLIKQALNDEQRNNVSAVAIDMSQSFQNAIEATLSKAKIVHDIFHIAKHLNEAVDKTRRWENSILLRDRNETLKGLRFEFLRNADSIDAELYNQFKALDASGYQTAKAWHFKELFKLFWKYENRSWAEKFFKRWYNKVIHSNLRYIKGVAKMLSKRIDNILNYFSHRITNAMSEGFNSKIQTVQSNSRGFRNFQNLRISVLFYCGKLNLKHNVAH